MTGALTNAAWTETSGRTQCLREVAEYDRSDEHAFELSRVESPSPATACVRRHGASFRRLADATSYLSCRVELESSDVRRASRCD